MEKYEKDIKQWTKIRNELSNKIIIQKIKEQDVIENAQLKSLQQISKYLPKNVILKQIDDLLKNINSINLPQFYEQQINELHSIKNIIAQSSERKLLEFGMTQSLMNEILNEIISTKKSITTKEYVKKDIKETPLEKFSRVFRSDEYKQINKLTNLIRELDIYKNIHIDALKESDNDKDYDTNLNILKSIYGKLSSIRKESVTKYGLGNTIQITADKSIKELSDFFKSYT